MESCRWIRIVHPGVLVRVYRSVENASIILFFLFWHAISWKKFKLYESFFFIEVYNRETALITVEMKSTFVTVIQFFEGKKISSQTPT